MSAVSLGVLAVLVAVAFAVEPVTRRLVAQRLIAVLGEAVGLPDGASAVMPDRPLAPSLLRRRVPELGVTAPTVVVGDLVVHDVEVELSDVALDGRLQVVGGTGAMAGHLTDEEVRRIADTPDRVRLEDGRASISLPGLSIRLRPVLDGDRIKLAPTPFSVPIPPLPAGAELTRVEAADDRLLVWVDIDLARFLSQSTNG